MITVRFLLKEKEGGLYEEQFSYQIDNGHRE